MSNSEELEPKAKRKRSLPGNPDPDAEVIALSPKSLLTTNRFICEICNKGFQRDQNLQLHRRGHNLPWKLKQRSNKDIKKKKVYVCPEISCVHHSPSRALGDLTGIKKHYCRKHGEKKWKCDKCSKKYAVFSDWKAHVKTCGTREYRCDCGVLFARKDSFVTHRAFCDALAEESARLIASSSASNSTNPPLFLPFSASSIWDPLISNANANPNPHPDVNPNPNPNPSSIFYVRVEHEDPVIRRPFTAAPSPHLSATALLQKASMMGPTTARHVEGTADPVSTWQGGKKLTRDFLGVSAGEEEELLSLNGLEMDMVGVDRVNSFGLPAEEECPCFL